MLTGIGFATVMLIPLPSKGVTALDNDVTHADQLMRSKSG
jgi:hypothetical protein